MAIKFTCACGKMLQVPEQFAGKSAKCPGCGRTLRVPAGEESVTAGVPPPLPVDRARTRDEASRAKPPPLPSEEDAAGEVEEVAIRITHAGRPVADDEDYFADPPAKIGRVLSASTTLNVDQRPRPTWLLVLAGLWAYVVSFGVSAGVVTLMRMPLQYDGEDVAFILVLPGLICIILGITAAWAMRFHHTCSYVGDKGIARFECSGRRRNVNVREMMLFKNAADLRTGYMVYYHNGIYTGTQYTFTWSNEKGKPIYKLTGRFRSQAYTPKVTDPYYFALAAEGAWSQYLLQNMDELVDDDGLLFFPLTRGNHVQLGKRLLVIRQGDKAIQLAADEIEQISVENGLVIIREVGGKDGWFVKSGFHQFKYDDLGNAQFFRFAVAQLLGIQF